MYCDMLSDYAIFTDLNICYLVFILVVLGGHSDCCIRIYICVILNLCMPINDNVWIDINIIAQNDITTDVRKCSDGSIVTYYGTIFNYGRGMYHSIYPPLSLHLFLLLLQGFQGHMPRPYISKHLLFF